MVLTRRSRINRKDATSRFDGSGKNSKKGKSTFVVPMTMLAVIIAMIRIISKLHTIPKYPAIPKNAIRIEEKVGLIVNLRRSNNGTTSFTITKGPHEAKLVISKPCNDPRFIMRLIGDEALVSIPIIQISKYEWHGTFEIPFPGTYIVEPRWYGCNDVAATPGYSKKVSSHKGETTRIIVSGRRERTGNPIVPSHTSLSDLILEGFWASPKLYDEHLPNKYFWITRAMGTEEPNILPSSTTTLGESMVAQEATPISDAFSDLSNYELLCWVGSNSARLIRESFLSLQPFIAKKQQKQQIQFHYYRTESFIHPDETWNDEEKKKFRKCKTIIISIDELSYPLTQIEYKVQVAIFLGHMIKIFDDATFPIWMLTVNLASTTSTTNMCTVPNKRSNHHPCNDALFDLFATSPFPDRVRLLDNTDLTSPLLEEDGLRDAVAVIAMRIFAIVGDQVKNWRKVNQRGIKNGLQRDGKIEPNIDLPIYDFNQ